MERYAWKGIVHDGCLEEYKRRHDEIWPEMLEVLKAAGIKNYTIWNVAAKVQAESPVVDKWNEYMKDVMTMAMDPVTGAQPKMKQMFLME